MVLASWTLRPLGGCDGLGMLVTRSIAAVSLVAAVELERRLVLSMVAKGKGHRDRVEGRGGAATRGDWCSTQEGKCKSIQFRSETP